LNNKFRTTKHDRHYRRSSQLLSDIFLLHEGLKGRESPQGKKTLRRETKRGREEEIVRTEGKDDERPSSEEKAVIKPKGLPGKVYERTRLKIEKSYKRLFREK